MKRFNHGPARVGAFMGLLLAAMLILRLVPAFSIGPYEVKKMDILADILPRETADTVSFTPPPAIKAKPVSGDTCPEGLVCIEDYAPDPSLNMGCFYKALSQRAALNRPVRIAYFGDSFIEGDIITADLREALQKRFGGCGVGFVDIASPFIELRPTVRHEAAHWTDHNILDKDGYDATKIGLSCRYAVPDSGAYVSYRGVKSYARLDSFDVATLYLMSSSPAIVCITASNRPAESRHTEGTDRLEKAETRGRMGRVSFSVMGEATCFGAALEGESGIILDNFSLRGSSGTLLAQIPERHLKQLFAERPYDLFILQFGLNVASKDVMEYDYYTSQMKRVVAHLRSTCPEAGILIIGIGDREDKIDGVLRTMPCVKALASYQQALAAEEGVAFWNLYEAMGGEGSIRRMAEAHPAEAAKDYTHINRRGGKRVADMLYKTLLHGYRQYEKKQDEERH